MMIVSPSSAMSGEERGDGGFPKEAPAIAVVSLDISPKHLLDKSGLFLSSC